MRRGTRTGVTALGVLLLLAGIPVPAAATEWWESPFDFVAVGNGVIYCSTNGVEWTESYENSVGAFEGENFKAVATDGPFTTFAQRWIAVGNSNYGNGDGTIHISMNGCDWAGAGAISQDGRGFLDIAYGPGGWLAVGENGLIWQHHDANSDDESWTTLPAPTDADITAVATDGYYWIIGTSDNRLMRSQDAETWSDIFATTEPPSGFSDIHYACGTWAANMGTHILRSTNGYTFTMGPPAGGPELAYNQEWRTVSPAGNGDAWSRSPDAASWTTQPNPYSVTAMAHEGNVWAAVGAGGTILTSPDGENWTAVDTGTTLNFATVASAATNREPSSGCPPPDEPLAPPMADFVVNLGTACGENVAVFDASASMPGNPDGAPIVGYAWDFGDMTSGTGVTAAHTYASDTSYEVVLTVTAEDGQTDTASMTIAVPPACVAPPAPPPPLPPPPPAPPPPPPPAQPPPPPSPEPDPAPAVYPPVRGVDADNDGVADSADNCPSIANHGQADADLDSVGDSCDAAPCDGCQEASAASIPVARRPPADLDDDGIPNSSDVCLTVPDYDQVDKDRDGLGDACDADLDGDGILQSGTVGLLLDNCPMKANSDQGDADNDGVGDACSPGASGLVLDGPRSNVAHHPVAATSNGWLMVALVAVGSIAAAAVVLIALGRIKPVARRRR